MASRVWVNAYMLPSKYLEIYKFHKKQQTLTEIRIEQDIAGVENPKKKKHIDHHEQIKRLVLGYDDSNCILDYIQGIAHNLFY